MCGCDCCKEQDVAVASRMGRVSRNATKGCDCEKGGVASRMGRVSRNSMLRYIAQPPFVASRMGRVSRNTKMDSKSEIAISRVPHGARE